MTRRGFLQKVLKWFLHGVSATFFPLFAGCRKGEMTIVEGERLNCLKNMTLKEISQNKLHHGRDRFISPFTEMDYGGRLPSVLKWKLMPSRFKHLFYKEKVTPVTVDWKTIHQDTGLSITYLNHAGMLIQDHGTRILVDPVFFGLSFFIKNG